MQRRSRLTLESFVFLHVFMADTQNNDNLYTNDFTLAKSAVSCFLFIIDVVHDNLLF